MEGEEAIIWGLKKSLFAEGHLKESVVLGQGRATTQGRTKEIDTLTLCFATLQTLTTDFSYWPDPVWCQSVQLYRSVQNCTEVYSCNPYRSASLGIVWERVECGSAGTNWKFSAFCSSLFLVSFLFQRKKNVSQYKGYMNPIIYHSLMN